MFASQVRTWAGALLFSLLPKCMLRHTVRQTYALCCWQVFELGSGSLDVVAFADRLWGDIYFNNNTRKFTRKAADPESPRTFVQFVLEPLYKLYSQVISEEFDSLKDTLAGLKIHLKPVMYKMDVRPLLKAVLDQFFGPSTGLIDMIIEWIPDPVRGATSKVRLVLYTPTYIFTAS